jgi:uncharacterized protein YjiS (DUF1127 family)
MEVNMLTALTLALAASIQRVLAAIWRSFAYRAKRFERAIEHRRAAQVLSRFDDRMLADIGISRADLRDAYADSLWADPTVRLRARALERRLARYGISNGLMIDPVLAPSLAPKVDAAMLKQAREAFCGCN